MADSETTNTEQKSTGELRTTYRCPNGSISGDDSPCRWCGEKVEPFERYKASTGRVVENLTEEAA